MRRSLKNKMKSNLRRAYRRNGADASVRESLTAVLVEAGLTPPRAKEYMDVFDIVLNEDGINLTEESSDEIIDSYLNMLIGLVTEELGQAAAPTLEAEAEEEDEKLTDYAKPFMFRGEINSTESALEALEAFVDVLFEEGPQGQAQPSNNVEPQKKRRGRPPKVRSNPKRFRPAYRSNPYLPADQDPLSVYRSRLISVDALFKPTPLDDYRAARLLRAHVQGTQAPPDFDKDQISAIVAVLWSKAVDTNEAQGLGWTIPAPGDPLNAFDYVIVHPAQGAARIFAGQTNIGTALWAWNRKNSYTLRFPYKPSMTNTDALSATQARGINSPVFRMDDNAFYTLAGLVQVLNDRGFLVEGEILNLQTPMYNVRLPIDSGWVVAKALVDAGVDLDNQSLHFLGMQLGAAWRTWAYTKLPRRSRQGLKEKGPPVSPYNETAFTEEARKDLAEFYAECGESDLVERLDFGGTNAALSWVAAHRVWVATEAITTTIVGLPVMSKYYPINWTYSPTPDVVVVRLPSSAVPFRLERKPQKLGSYILYLGVAADNSYIRPDGVEWRTNKTIARQPFGVDTSDKEYKLDDPKKVPELTYTHFGAGRNVDGKVKWNRGIELNTIHPDVSPAKSQANLLQLLRNMETYSPYNSRALLNGDSAFSLSFVNQRNMANAPKILTEDFPLVPAAMAMRRLILSQGGSKARPLTMLGDIPLTLALSEAIASPSYYRDTETKELMPTPVGAARIDPVTVVSRDTGKKIVADGLPASLKEAIRPFLPPSSFVGRVWQTTAGKVGEKVIRKKVIFRPYPYQQVGIAFAHASNCRAMIGDEMGLGKTIQALGMLAVSPSPSTGIQMTPALILAPASVVGSWVSEVQRWLPHLRVGTVSGKANSDLDVSIMSWGSVSGNWEAHAGRYNTLIVDEAHYGKRLFKRPQNRAPTFAELLNPNAKIKQAIESVYTGRTYGFVNLCHTTAHVLLLSGTLMENGGRDIGNLWTYLHALDPQRFPDAKAFLDNYSKSTSDGVRKFDVAKLRQDFNSYHIRRLKASVAEQIQLGCLYLPEYPECDRGCPGREIIEDTVLGAEGAKENPRRAIKRIGASRGVKRNTTKAGGNEGGYISVGINKIVEKVSINMTPEQQTQYDAMLEGLADEIRLRKKEQAIEAVISRVTRGGQVNLNELANALVAVNERLEEINFESLASSARSSIPYLRRNIAQIKVTNAALVVANSIKQDREPIIVWVDLQAVADNIFLLLEEAGVKNIRMITGKTPKEERTAIVRDFQEGKVDVLLASKALREGVTLTRANRAVFVEQWWVPAWMSQAEDRIYRIGQTRDCTIKYLLIPDSYDTVMWDSLADKRRVQASVFGSEEFVREDTAQDTSVVQAAYTMSEEDLNTLRNEVVDAEDEEGDTNQGEVLLLVAEAAQKAIKDALEKFADLAEIRANLFVTEDDIRERLKDSGAKVISYSITKKGLDYQNWIELKVSSEEAIEKLSRLTGVNLDGATKEGIRYAQYIQSQDRKVTEAEMANFDRGQEYYRALITLTSNSNASVSRYIRHVVSDPMAEDSSRVLIAVLSIEGINVNTKLSAIRVGSAAGKLYGTTWKSTGQIMKILNDLASKGYIKKEEELWKENSGTAAQNLSNSHIFEQQCHLGIAIGDNDPKRALIAYNNLCDLVERASRRGLSVSEEAIKRMNSGYAYLSQQAKRQRSRAKSRRK